MRHHGFKTIGTAPGAQRRATRGFTLVEILIVVVILGILATVVVPQLSSASKDARENTLKDEMRYLRTQLQVFKAQHDDIAAGYPGGATSATPTEAAFIDQMTRSSDEKCNTSATSSNVYNLGPYLSQMPNNPINNKNGVRVIGNGTAMPAPAASDADTYGWIYKPSTQELLPDLTGNDSNGVPFTKY